MKVKIKDVNQFLEFASIVKCLNKIKEENKLVLKSEIEYILGDIKKELKNNLKLDSPLTQFTKEFNLSIIDLDLLQISIGIQKNSITYTDYINNSILKIDLDYNTTIKKINQSSLIRNGYLVLEDPFMNPKEFQAKSLNKLIFSKIAQTKEGELYLNIYVEKYRIFGDFIQNAYLLNQIDSFKDENINSLHLKKLYQEYSYNLNYEYDYNLKNNSAPFCKYLKKNNVSLNEAMCLIKSTDGEIDWGFFLDDAFLRKYTSNNIINKLRQKKLIKSEHNELTNESKKELLDISTEKENDFFNIEKPKQTFDSVCLNPDIKSKILSTINQTKNSNKIFNEWKINIDYGKGISMNFSGIPGTGKTLTAKAVANYLNKELLTVKYSELESMWVGECEKNISNAFKIAKEKNAVLFFDEADSLATSRKNAVSWIVSRTNTLLKELEDFEGVCIFATNFSENYDEAFNRRLTTHIHFGLPDKHQLKKIFEIHFPNKGALHKNVNFSKFSKNYAGILSGGDVKNIVLNSARTAASDNSEQIKMKHLNIACEMVLGGKECSQEEIGNNYIG